MSFLAGRFATRALLLLSDQQLRCLWSDVLERRSMALAPDKGMRFLLSLENDLYDLEGRVAIRYGAGEHPKLRLTQYCDFFVSHVRPGERVLDIGCGTGAVARAIGEKAGAKVVGIDLSQANIAMAAKRYGHRRVRYVVGDASECLPRGHFDAVILSNVLEHLTQRPRFLRRVRASANPSRYLVRVPLSERDWRVPLKREVGVEWRLDLGHQTEYTPESLAQELAAAGLSITHQTIRWGEIWVVATPNSSETPRGISARQGKMREIARAHRPQSQPPRDALCKREAKGLTKQPVSGLLAGCVRPCVR